MGSVGNLGNATTTSANFSKVVRNLWVVRHGERIDRVDPDWIKTAPRGAWDDPPLSEKGFQQAKEVGIRLKDEDIDYVFCSPFVRCIQTVSTIMKELKNNTKLKLFVEPGFIEALCMTQFPPGCLTPNELFHEYNLVDATYEPFFKKFLPENDEFACEQRIRGTIESILEKYPGNILIVSHGSPTAAIHTVLGRRHREIGFCAISHFLVTPLTETSTATKIDNTGFKYSFKCILAGDLSHLSDQDNLSVNRL